MHRRSLLAATAAATLLATGGITAASASSTSSDGFENFGIGNVNGQNGWTMTGPYDVAIADPTAFGVDDMGTRALRLSKRRDLGQLQRPDVLGRAVGRGRRVDGRGRRVGRRPSVNLHRVLLAEDDLARRAAGPGHERQPRPW